jgi:hypothetical protein
MIPVLAVVLAATSCSMEGISRETATGDGTRYDHSRAACEDHGLAWAGGERRCLTPAQIARWKTSRCGDRGFFACERRGFPDVGNTSKLTNLSNFGSKRLKRRSGATPAQPLWSCFYSATYDRDWHNDVLCSNGADSERPHLLAGDSFVTQAEIVAAARLYERQLNGG